jgi:serine/threonine protein phosphatase PrpC
VSAIFENELKSCDAYKQKDYKKALQETFRRIDEVIESPEGQKQLYDIRYGDSKMQKETSEADREFIGGAVGCTANVVLVTPNAYFVANAGDSRSALCRDGKAIDLSKDHKPDSPEEEARIKKAGGYISMGRVNGGLNLTRSFADFDYKKNKALPFNEQMITCNPDIEEFEVTGKDEFILVGCDGIWEKYVENSQGLIDVVKENLKKKEAKQVAEDMLDFLLATDTNSGIGCDNMTTILIIIHH